jgi:sulfite oxidase
MAWREDGSVLEAAGVHHDDGLHVAFSAPDSAPEAVPVQCYGSSIPLPKAMSEEVLLAWEMNSKPLPRVHGGPVRVVVPGYIGARSVKWVAAISVQSGPSGNYFQASDYRVLPPEADPTPQRRVRAFRCRRCPSTATSWSLATTR